MGIGDGEINELQRFSFLNLQLWKRHRNCGLKTENYNRTNLIQLFDFLIFSNG